jgi:hypothetical protein
MVYLNNSDAPLPCLISWPGCKILNIDQTKCLDCDYMQMLSAEYARCSSYSDRPNLNSMKSCLSLSLTNATKDSGFILMTPWAYQHIYSAVAGPALLPQPHRPVIQPLFFSTGLVTVLEAVGPSIPPSPLSSEAPDGEVASRLFRSSSARCSWDW